MSTATWSWPSVEVIVPTYNRLAMLKGAVTSVLDTNYPSLSVLVVDDGSADGTIEWAKYMVQACGQFDFVSQRHRGRPGAVRNLGVRNAVAKYITFLDDDDLMPEGRLNEQVEFFLNGSLDIVTGNEELVKETEYLPEWMPADVLSRVHPYVLTAMGEREFFDSHPFSEDLEVLDDIEWMDRIKTEGAEILHVEDVVWVRRRWHGGNLTGVKHDKVLEEHRYLHDRKWERIMKEPTNP